jgi:EmrB/QacA subfamily drug resistance transporter
MSPATHHERRWLILALIGIAQLMIVLDLTIVNIALPSAQQDLGFSDDARQWIITAYALAFGSLLLLGGKLGDLFGRKWAFIGGLIGFAVASAVGGAAGSFGVLVGARAAQGVFGALLAPSALALLAITFTDPAERGKAFGIFGAIAGGGSAIGLLLGGMLTEWLDWRWCLYVNLLIAVPAAFAALRLIENVGHPERPRLDLVGTVLATTGLFALVYGFSNSEMHSWGHPMTIVSLAVAVVLLATFAFVESRVEHPLLPLRVIADRVRGGSYLAIGISGAALFAVFLFLTYYLQQTKGFSPIQTGLAYLPMTAAIITTATSVNIKFLAKVGPRPLLVLGLTLGAVAMAWFAQLDTTSSYAGHVLPGLVVMGVGMGNIFAPAISSATYGVAATDTGVASAMVNTMQQVGGSIGTALLSSIFASAVSSFAQSHPPGPQVAADAAMHGYTVAFWVAAGVFAFGAIVVGSLMRSIKVEAHAPGEATSEPAVAHS